MLADLEKRIDETPIPENFKELPLGEKILSLWPIIEMILKVIQFFSNKKRKAKIKTICEGMENEFPGETNY